MTDSLIPYSFVPGTKAKASEVNANFIALANEIASSNSSISNLSDTMNASLADKLDMDMSNTNNITNCILAAPNGVASYSGLTITVKSGLKVLIPNGLNSDNSLKNIAYTLTTDISTTDSLTNGNMIFCLTSSGNIVLVQKLNYLFGEDSSKPSALSNTGTHLYFATDTNKMYVSSNSTTASWSEFQACILGEYSVINSAISTFNTYSCLNLTNSANLSLSNLDEFSTYNVLKPNNTAMLIQGAKKLATIGSRNYYKSYDDDCICGLATETNGNTALVMVSETSRGATGYDDSNTTPRTTGTFVWRGKVWFYFVGTSTALSGGLKKWGNIPLIYKTGSNSDLPKYVLETYYSSVTYSMPHKNYVNASYWYRIWGDGWTEQGGITSATASVSIVLSVPFSNTHYNIIAVKNGNTSDSRSSITIENKATTGFTLTSSDARPKNWYACGY